MVPVRRTRDLEEQVLIDQQERKKTAAVSKARRSTYFAARYSKKKKEKDHQMDGHNSSGKRKADGKPAHDDGNGMARDGAVTFATPVGQAIGTTSDGTTTEAILVQSAMKVLEVKTSSVATTSKLTETYMAGSQDRQGSAGCQGSQARRRCGRSLRHHSCRSLWNRHGDSYDVGGADAVNVSW
jgi:hypothetical protein